MRGYSILIMRGSESQIWGKVLGTEPKFVQKSGAEPTTDRESGCLVWGIHLVAGLGSPFLLISDDFLLRRALLAARQHPAHPFPIYEMGSRQMESSTDADVVQLVVAIFRR